ncbi:hypothetical protein H6P81_010333 [Aristolochia fimbriata]|uniref:Uncharacterized protein n=1 Tax=Aristolochia fimbriata TaxID=158543 RepID=A0AAV7ENG4_ARIFI|nr:hypothetical protein H6P81_010333 [Aristolochia fimbriata]
MQFALKYGKEFVAAATELMPCCGVNRSPVKVIELLPVRAPSPEIKLKLLKDIAEEHELDWDPAATEGEYFKQHEYLLNGPTQFISGSKLPLPKEKHDESFLSSPVQAPHKQLQSESSFEDKDLPEVPNTENSPSHLSSPSMDSQQEFNTSGANEYAKHKYHSEQDEVQPKSLLQNHRYHPAQLKVQRWTSNSFHSLSHFLLHLWIRKKSHPSFQGPHEQSQFPAQTLSRTNSEAPVLQEVLAAAQASEETAERAAAAARSAASLMHLRTSELNQRKEEPQVQDNNEKEFEMDDLKHPAVSDSPAFPNGDNNPGLLSLKSPVFDSPKMESDAVAPAPGNKAPGTSLPNNP